MAHKGLVKYICCISSRYDTLFAHFLAVIERWWGGNNVLQDLVARGGVGASEHKFGDVTVCLAPDKAITAYCLLYTYCKRAGSLA